MFDSNDNGTQDPATSDNSTPVAADIFSGSATTPSDSSSTDSTSTPFGAPSLPASDDTSSSSSEPDTPDTPSPSEPTDEPKTEDVTTSETPTPLSSTKDDDDAVMKSAPSEDLASMKQEALGHLQPLVAHLELSPEEEFKTTMMMIQANDDQTLLKKAFEAAKKITDDKARAQALLDVINEINYFTQHAE